MTDRDFLMPAPVAPSAPLQEAAPSAYRFQQRIPVGAAAERCDVCGGPAYHEVGIDLDEGTPERLYVCSTHLRLARTRLTRFMADLDDAMEAKCKS